MEPFIQRGSLIYWHALYQRLFWLKRSPSPFLPRIGFIQVSSQVNTVSQIIKKPWESESRGYPSDLIVRQNSASVLVTQFN